MRRLVAGELVGHTLENPGGPTGASLRGRLLTISVHTVLSLKSFGGSSPTIENPWLTVEPEVVR